MSIRKVKVLQGRAKEEAEKQGLSPDDLVIVTTTIKKGSLPEYYLEKIKGDPVSFLLMKINPECGEVKNIGKKTFMWDCKHKEWIDVTSPPNYKEWEKTMVPIK